MIGQLTAEQKTIETSYIGTWSLPLWVTIVIVVLLAGFCWGVYFLERGTIGKRWRIALAFNRFALLLCLLWMLGGWYWLRHEVERPKLVVVVDSSASMATRDVDVSVSNGEISSDPRSRWEAATKFVAEVLEAEALKNYSVQLMQVAEQPMPLAVELLEAGEATADLGAQSRLGSGLEEIVQRESGSGTAAIVFLSDGINTSGVSLSRAADQARRATIPVYAIAIGRDFAQPDVRLSDLLVDRQVYLGDRVTLQLTVLASDVPEADLSVSLMDISTGQQLDSKAVHVAPEVSSQEVLLAFEPRRVGEIPLQITIQALAGEDDRLNNEIQTSVTVQDRSIKVLMVFGEPSYEFRFLKHLLERSVQGDDFKHATYEVQSVLQSSDVEYVRQDEAAVRLVPSDGSLISDMDVFVFGDFDPTLVSASAQKAIFDSVVEGGAGCIFVYGQGANPDRLDGWPIGKLMPILYPEQVENPAVQGPFTWEPTVLGDAAMPLQLGDNSGGPWNLLPSFNSLLQIGNLKLGSQVLAVAREATTGADFPLLVYQFAGAGRAAFQASDETYLWTSYNGSDAIHQQYWGQMLRWLSRGRLQNTDTTTLSISPKQVKQGAPVNFQVRLGKDIGAIEYGDVVRLAVTAATDETRLVDLPKVLNQATLYRASVDDFLPGSYSVRIVEPLVNSIDQEFVISAPPGEQANLRVDVPAMQYLANHTRGKFYRFEETGQLVEELPRGKATRISSLPPVPIWNNNWVALLFVLLITTEWLFRRRCRLL